MSFHPPQNAEMCEIIKDQIDLTRRLVMTLYGGNLDHPALDHLEAAWGQIAMTQVQDSHERALS